MLSPKYEPENLRFSRFSDDVCDLGLGNSLQNHCGRPSETDCTY